MHTNDTHTHIHTIFFFLLPPTFFHLFLSCSLSLSPFHLHLHLISSIIVSEKKMQYLPNYLTTYLPNNKQQTNN